MLHRYHLQFFRLYGWPLSRWILWTSSVSFNTCSFFFTESKSEFLIGLRSWVSVCWRMSILNVFFSSSSPKFDLIRWNLSASFNWLPDIPGWDSPFIRLSIRSLSSSAFVELSSTSLPFVRYRQIVTGSKVQSVSEKKTYRQCILC